MSNPRFLPANGAVPAAFAGRPFGVSTLMISAPSVPSRPVVNGPATALVKSMTRTPASGRLPSEGNGRPGAKGSRSSNTSASKCELPSIGAGRFTHGVP